MILWTEEETWLSIAVLIFIIIDYITGVINAALKKNISSQKMREGLGHKATYIILLSVCYTIDAIQLNTELNLPTKLFPIVSCGILLIELTSIIENICEINPELKQANFMYIFEKNNTETKEKNDENDMER